jgi:hypothetical protein
METVMSEPYNGMPATGLGDINWLKSKHSNPSGNCVEVACLPGGEIAMRNSRFPGGPVLLYTQAEVAAFLAGAKDGEFDGMVAGLSDPENRAERRVTAIAPGGPN